MPGLPRGPGGADRAAGLVDAAVAQERIEDAGEAPGEGDDGNVLAAAGRDAPGPAPERVGRGRVAAKDGDGGLDEQPAGAAGPGLGDGAAALRVPGAELARDQTEVRVDVVGVAIRRDRLILPSGTPARQPGHGDQAGGDERLELWIAGHDDRPMILRSDDREGIGVRDQEARLDMGRGEHGAS